LSTTPHPDDDAWAQKVELIANIRPDVASFTFDCPPPDVLAGLHGLWVPTLVTVTSRAEADIAVAAGADGLVGQGPGAGGHRGTFMSDRMPSTRPLDDLLAQILGAHPVPVIAAGGLATADDVLRVLGAGAVAAQVGAALLSSDEAGTNAVHRAALQSPRFANTVVTRAFSGV
jgi:nitronate monooxygenase